MKNSRMMCSVLVAALIVLEGCATRPVNPPLKEASLDSGYTFQTRQKYFRAQDTLVILAFSGGGTRAAAFSYGVLEFLLEHDRSLGRVVEGRKAAPARCRRRDHRRRGW